jgi:hypothetical protein
MENKDYTKWYDMPHCQAAYMVNVGEPISKIFTKHETVKHGQSLSDAVQDITERNLRETASILFADQQTYNSSVIKLAWKRLSNSRFMDNRQEDLDIWEQQDIAMSSELWETGLDGVDIPLKKREKEYYSRLLQGYTNDETSALIGVSARTGKNIKKNIVTKLRKNVKSSGFIWNYQNDPGELHSIDLSFLRYRIVDRKQKDVYSFDPSPLFCSLPSYTPIKINDLRIINGVFDPKIDTTKHDKGMDIRARNRAYTVAYQLRGLQGALPKAQDMPERVNVSFPEYRPYQNDGNHIKRAQVKLSFNTACRLGFYVDAVFGIHGKMVFKGKWEFVRCNRSGALSYYC